MVDPPPRGHSPVHAISKEAVMEAGGKLDSLEICGSVVEDIFEKAAEKIIDQMYTKMRPGFVRKQVMIQM